MDAGFLFAFNEGRTPEGTIPGKESVGSSREQRPGAMQAQLPRRGNRRIAGYVIVAATKKANIKTSQDAQVIVSRSLIEP